MRNERGAFYGMTINLIVSAYRRFKGESGFARVATHQDILEPRPVL